MTQNVIYLYFSPYLENVCVSDGYGMYDGFEQKAGFNIKNINLKDKQESTYKIKFGSGTQITPFVLACETNTFTHILIKNFSLNPIDSFNEDDIKIKKLLNNSIHIITSNSNVIGKYQIMASLKNNIQVRTYKISKSFIICEHLFWNSQSDLHPPDPIFINIDEKYIIDTHKYIEENIDHNDKTKQINWNEISFE